MKTIVVNVNLIVDVPDDVDTDEICVNLDESQVEFETIDGEPIDGIVTDYTTAGAREEVEGEPSETY